MNNWYSYLDYDWTGSEKWAGFVGGGREAEEARFTGGTPYFDETGQRFKNIALFGIALVAGLLIFRK